MEKKEYPAKRLTLEQRKKYLVYQTNKDFILKAIEVGAITKEEVEELEQMEFPFCKELDDITKDSIDSL